MQPRFAKLVFRTAGIYGILVLAPQYFLFDRIGQDHPPAINHPEYFYGFVGCALVFQLVFLLISTDPIRYRPLMPIALLEKLAFFLPCTFLILQRRIPADVYAFSVLDLLLGILFTVAWFKTPHSTLPAGHMYTKE